MGYFALRMATIGAWRLVANSPPLAGLSASIRDIFSVLIAPVSKANSLLTGNFAISRLSMAAMELKTTALMIFGEFPTQINRENISTNREFSRENREFSAWPA